MAQRWIGATLFLLTANLSVAGQSPANQPATDQKPPVWKEYRIGPEDVLTISVWKNGDLTGKVQVRPDGKISMPLLNDVQAAGLTPTELRQKLTESLSAFMETPVVSILVDEIHSFKISILGKVRSPGRYELRSATTALDALALAGGFLESDFSSPEEMVILRESQGVTKRITIRYKTAISPAGQQVNIYLQPDDILVVP